MEPIAVVGGRHLRRRQAGAGGRSGDSFIFLDASGFGGLFHRAVSRETVETETTPEGEPGWIPRVRVRGPGRPRSWCSPGGSPHRSLGLWLSYLVRVGGMPVSVLVLDVGLDSDLRGQTWDAEGVGRAARKQKRPRPCGCAPTRGRDVFACSRRHLPCRREASSLRRVQNEQRSGSPDCARRGVEGRAPCPRGDRFPLRGGADSKGASEGCFAARRRSVLFVDIPSRSCGAGL
jgi:hypothetical protein